MATYEPPAAVRDEAALAVEWIEAGLAGDGFTTVGRRRAQQLADGDPVSVETLERMRSYFARHEADSEVEGFNAGEDGFPTPGRVAWSAWGGDPGRAWADDELMDVEGTTNDQAASSATSTTGEQMREQLATTDIGRRALDHDRERRAFATVDWQEVRDDSDVVTFRGYASVFDAPYDVAGLFTERVARTAFNRTLSHDRKIHLLVGHEGIPLASTASGTLVLRADDHGLLVDAELDMDSPLARTVASAVRRGDMDEMSFGFYVREDDWSDDMTERELLEVQLDEVSIVRRGANPATSGEIVDVPATVADEETTEIAPVRSAADALDVRLRFSQAEGV